MSKSLKNSLDFIVGKKYVQNMKINYPRPLTHYRHTYWTMKSVSAQNVSLSRTRRLPHLQGQPGSPIQIQLLPPQPLLWKVTVNCYQATRTSLSNCEKGRNDWYDSTVKTLNSIFTSKKCQDFRFLSQDVKSLEVLSPTFTTTRKMNRLQLFFFFRSIKVLRSQDKLPPWNLES